jgi:hypothetical protein
LNCLIKNDYRRNSRDRKVNSPFVKFIFESYVLQ